MPDEIGWLSPEDEAKLDEAREEANRVAPQTTAGRDEVTKRARTARDYRERTQREPLLKKET